MLFSQTAFLFMFLPVCLIGYYLIDRRFKNYFLLAMSILFYAWGEPKFIFIMIGSIFVNYGFGLAVDKFRNNRIVSRILIALMVAFNLSIFFVYKYLNFTISNINSIFGVDLVMTNFVLPIGISFYTFQAMSYVLDVYRGRGQVQKNPLNVMLYIMLFPQLIAGPIVRYETVALEINNRKETLNDFVTGLGRFVFGLGKKLIISNAVAVIADKAFNIGDFSELSVTAAWIGAICYSLQIYFDFSGYSDMAIGLGLMFGFHFEENFNYPYISSTVSEFWRRWHISLGSWFRDYVYFPLGGSRVKSKFRLVFNLFVVWGLTGIWHGANWTFIAWGLFYFVLLAFEKLTGIGKKMEKYKLLSVIYRIFTLLCVVFGWVLFRANNITEAAKYILSMFGVLGNPLTDSNMMYYLGQYSLLIVVAIVLSTPVIPHIKSKITKFVDNTGKKSLSCVIDIAGKLIVISCAVVAISYATSVSFNPFIYFNF